MKFGTKINVQTGQIVQGVYLALWVLPTRGVHLVQLQREIEEHGPASVQPGGCLSGREGTSVRLCIWG